MCLTRNIVANMEGCSVEELLMPWNEVVTVSKEQLGQHKEGSLDSSIVQTSESPARQQQSPHSKVQNKSGKSATASTAVQQEVLTEERKLEEYKRRAIEAEEKVRQLTAEVKGYEQLIEEKTKVIQQSNATSHKLRQSLRAAEEADQAVRQQLQERDEQLARNQDIVQDMQARLKQSDEAVQVATQQVREREQEALQYVDNVRVLENQIQELTEEAAEAQQLVTELEQQLLQAERRLANSDQIFQDIFQRLLGQLPQSQPHWVVQRREIQLTDEQLGTGGWASVKVAIFRGQRVAAKCLHDQIISAHNIRLFTREMSMAAQARHPNLLQFVGATMDNNPIILTELMPTSLRRILEQGVHLNRHQVISIASDVARALNYLHLNTPDPIIHRDISSANVLLEQFGEVYKAKVSDYGSANFSRYTATAGPGNPLYSAPESGNPSQQSVKMDVYSFGLLLIEMCSGELFNDHEELIRNRIGDWPEIVTIIRPCIRRDPKRRPNIDAVLTQLTQIHLH